VVVVGLAGEVVAGPLVALVAGGALALEEVVGGGVVDDGAAVGVPLGVVGTWGSGGDVARGDGQVGSR